MIRETNEVDNQQPGAAEQAAAAGSDILVRIHANGSENTAVSGALTMAPSAENPYGGAMPESASGFPSIFSTPSARPRELPARAYI